MALIIKTDHKWKPFKDSSEVPANVREGQFDYLSAEDAGHFFKYQNTWYHLGDFMLTPSDVAWDGNMSESFWTGVFIKVSSDGETYKVASYRVVSDNTTK